MTTATKVEEFCAALKIANALPKTELHLHLDGSITPEFIFARAAARGIACPGSVAELRAMIDAMKRDMAASAGSGDARDITRVGAKKNWPIFDWMNQFLQTEEELEEGTRSLCRHLYDDHRVWLAEIRFCPALHTEEGMSEAAAVAAVCRGFGRARDECGIAGGVVLCALRSYPSPHPVQTAALCREFMGKGVVGFDVAGSETYALSLDAIQEGLQACIDWGVPITVHAGELPRGMVPNVETALTCGAARIGHGMAMAYGEVLEHPGEDEALMQQAASRGVLVEVCLTSICQASRVPTYDVHPIRKMIRAGVMVCLNCDNLTLSGNPDTAGAYPTHGVSYAYPGGEIAHLVADCGGSWAEVRAALLNGVRGSFAKPCAEFQARFSAAVDEAFALHGISA